MHTVDVPFVSSKQFASYSYKQKGFDATSMVTLPSALILPNAQPSPGSWHYTGATLLLYLPSSGETQEKTPEKTPSQQL